MTTPITGIDSNEFLQSQDIQQIQQQQLLNNKAIRPTLQYGVDKGELTEKDAVSYLQTGSMSQEGQSALSALVQRLNENYNTIMEFFQTNEDVGENEEEITSAEKAKIDVVMSDGIATDEELQEVLEETSQEEETEEEPVEEEPPMEEPGGNWRADQVNAAFEAFLSDLEEGKGFDINNHKGINAVDYNGIVADFLDDGIVGNGARVDQFENDIISSHTGDLAQKAKAAGKNLSYTYTDENGKKQTQTLKGVYDNNDDKYTYKDEALFEKENKAKEKEKPKEENDNSAE